MLLFTMPSMSVLGPRYFEAARAHVMPHDLEHALAHTQIHAYVSCVFLMAHNTRMCVVCLFLDVGHHDNQRQVMKWERMHCDQCSTPKLVK